jgi:hypothetical protein
MTPAMRKRIRFFADNAGYCTPPGRMVCAKHLADAEAFAEEIGLTCEWEYENEDWMSFAGDPEEEYRENFASGKWVCMYAVVRGDNREVLASLGGIVIGHSRADDNYRRVVEAELFQEAIAAIRKGGAA